MAEELWGSDIERPRSVINVSSGGYMVASNTSSIDGDLAGNVLGRNVWLLRLDAQGEMIWQNWYGSVLTASSSLQIRETSDGGFIVATTIGIDATGVGCVLNDTQGWVFKVDENGELEWERCMGGSDIDGFGSVERTLDGGYILTGGSRSSDGDLSANNGQNDIWVVKLDTDGNVMWSRNYGGSDTEGASHVIPTANGGFLVGGAGRSNDLLVEGCNPYSNVNNTVFILKLDAEGEVTWRKCYGGNNNDVISRVIQDPIENYWIIGTTRSTDGVISGDHHGEIDGWIIKLDSSGAPICPGTEACPAALLVIKTNAPSIRCFKQFLPNMSFGFSCSRKPKGPERCLPYSANTNL